ncbi:endolytic transglycosylase MltG [Seongchinamella sediminis]|uniref:Endolytic murein transglycosylase n=1 Tax=Seongchinamella sediminis TaxID=2283635 RepID=A0A3L7E2V3_9GAMM|nr:endolytic transglycosylase MltG [Seongchinamella sediminis]RLQ23120.1 endolytic transglycosylase MltG [Seongchinamella sediminis]
MLKKLLLSLLVLAAIVAVALNLLQQRWQQPLAIPGQGYLLDVGAGETLRSVAAQLEADGVTGDGWMLRLYGRWTGLDQQIKRGEYRIPAGTTARALLQLLQEGRVISYQVTLPEGISLSRALEILAASDELQTTLAGTEDSRLLALAAPYAHPEGLFFPDSYQFERGATDHDILRRARAAMIRVLEEEWQGREEGLPYDSPYEALVMASIIERETGLEHERGEIAGVFVRRLNQNMRLQTDPTIIYGLGERFDGNLRRSHLRDDENPYNTYRHRGLPPTPIALPGREAIHAALHPAPGSSLYFVARGDGGHYFSDTLAEHQRAVRKYQLQRREDYRSSPPPE